MECGGDYRRCRQDCLAQGCPGDARAAHGCVLEGWEVGPVDGRLHGRPQRDVCRPPGAQVGRFPTSSPPSGRGLPPVGWSRVVGFCAAQPIEHSMGRRGYPPGVPPQGAGSGRGREAGRRGRQGALGSSTSWPAHSCGGYLTGAGRNRSVTPHGSRTPAPCRPAKDRPSAKVER